MTIFSGTQLNYLCLLDRFGVHHWWECCTWSCRCNLVGRHFLCEQCKSEYLLSPYAEQFNAFRIHSSFSFLQTSCSTLNKYLMGPLGRYLLNVTKAAEQCSQLLCKFHGRCQRRAADSDVYLHLSASTHRITSQNGQLKVTGKPGQAELLFFHKHFKCQCYTGYKGDGCEQKERGQNRAPSVLGTWPLRLLLPLGLLFVLH